MPPARHLAHARHDRARVDRRPTGTRRAARRSRAAAARPRGSRGAAARPASANARARRPARGRGRQRPVAAGRQRPVRPRSPVWRGRQLGDPGEDRALRRACSRRRGSGAAPRRRPRATRPGWQSSALISEANSEHAAVLPVVERLLAEPVAGRGTARRRRASQSAKANIPRSRSTHALAEASPRPEDHLGVAPRAEARAARLEQLVAQLAKVVDLAVEDEPDALRRRWSSAGGR